MESTRRIIKGCSVGTVFPEMEAVEVKGVIPVEEEMVVVVQGVDREGLVVLVAEVVEMVARHRSKRKL